MPNGAATRCAKTCKSCCSSCVKSCDTCKARCHDDVCLATCATSCGACRQGCITTKDHCGTATCSAEASTCSEQFQNAYKARHCEDKIPAFSTCLDHCTSAVDKATKDGNVSIMQYRECQDTCIRKAMGPQCANFLRSSARFDRQAARKREDRRTLDYIGSTTARAKYARFRSRCPFEVMSQGPSVPSGMRVAESISSRYCPLP